MMKAGTKGGARTGKTLIAYTGAAYKDGRYGWGLLLMSASEGPVARGYCGYTTTNVASGELEAVRKAVQYAYDYGYRRVLVRYRDENVRRWGDGTGTEDQEIRDNYADLLAALQEDGVGIQYEAVEDDHGWATGIAAQLAQMGASGTVHDTDVDGIPAINKKVDPEEEPYRPGIKLLPEDKAALAAAITRSMLREAALLDMIRSEDATDLDSMVARIAAIAEQDPDLRKPIRSEKTMDDALMAAAELYGEKVVEPTILAAESGDHERPPVRRGRPPLSPKKQLSEYSRLYKIISAAIERARKRNKVSYEEIAERSGVPEYVVRKVERGVYQVRVETMRKIAQVLGLGGMPELAELEGHEQTLWPALGGALQY